MPNRPTARVQILEALAHGAMTVPELCEELPHMAMSGISACVHRAHEIGAVRIDGWHRNLGTRGRMSPMWALADGRPDAPMPVLDRHQERLDVTRRWRATHRARLALKQAQRAGREITPMTLMMYVPAPDRRVKVAR